MSYDPSAFDPWSLAIISALAFVIFMIGLAKPQSARDWRSLGTISVLLVAALIVLPATAATTPTASDAPAYTFWPGGEAHAAAGASASEAQAYGLWSLVIINSLVFIIFAFSFAKPQSSRDWRSFGAFSAFLVALFTEMYGFPLTIYLLSGWLTSRFPGVDWTSHDAGHLLEMMVGWRSNPHFGPFHILSFALIGGGFWLLTAAWRVLYHAQRAHRLATVGPYARLRHPQYVGFILIMLGFLVQWPTLVTLAMFPVLVTMYVLLAKREEREAEAEFGDEYRRYAAHTPGFFPRLDGPTATGGRRAS